MKFYLKIVSVYVDAFFFFSSACMCGLYLIVIQICLYLYTEYGTLYYHSNMTSIKRHTRFYSISLYLAQVRYTTNLAVPCDSRCEITVTTECKQTKHRHITYF